MSDQELRSSETLLAKIRRLAEDLAELNEFYPNTPAQKVAAATLAPILEDPKTVLALVECVERLKLVAAADEKAVRELKDTFGVVVDPQAESFELMDGNKAALAKLEAL